MRVPVRPWPSEARSACALGASGLAALAAVVASLDRDSDIVPFFVALTLAGGVAAWAAHPPFGGVRRRIVHAIALGWLVAAVWVAILLVMYLTVWAGSGPPPVPEDTYLGLTATVYHLAGLYGGGALLWTAAFGSGRTFRGSDSPVGTRPAPV